MTYDKKLPFVFNSKKPKVFSETLVPKEGHFNPQANFKPKDATKTKLCTVIVRHISTKNQQLDFPNSHCSIVYSYCSIVCLIIKSGSKMVKTSNVSYENEIHRVDSPFNEDSKNIIFLAREALISGEGRPENLGKMAKNEETYCHFDPPPLGFLRVNTMGIKNNS